MARNGAAYCTKDDLLIGDVILGAALSPEKFVEDAADEIDSYLGRIYEIPIVGTDEVSALVLKRINTWLASGRLLMAVAVSTQDAEVNAYGWSLIQQALGDIRKIETSDIYLTGDGVVRADSSTVGDNDTGPSVSNRDEYSAVETFYGEYLDGSVWRPGPANS